MAHQRIKPYDEGSNCACYSSIRSFNGEIPQFNESVFHSNCEEPIVAPAIKTDPRKGHDAATELGKSREQLHRRLIFHCPDLHRLVPRACGKFVAMWIPRACPYDSFVCLLLSYELVTNFIGA
ncbi:hypothetical protein ACFX2B_010962 [Malus domestica]